MWQTGLLAVALLLPYLGSTAAQSCTGGTNKHGTCACAEQIFLNSDCSEGYYCSSAEEGCVLSCPEGELILIDPRNGSSVLDYQCVSRATHGGICPGKMNTDCPCTGEGCEFGECECAKQLWVSSDCKTAKFCNDRSPEENQIKNCTEGGQIVDVNLLSQSWKCIPDDGRCLNRSFRLGCQKEGTTIPPTTPTKPPITICSYANNTLGTCECGKQLFINEDCTEGFFCMDGTFPPGVVADGCQKKCQKNEIIVVNPAKNEWNCVPKSVSPGVLPLICPGKFKIECPGNGDIGECECDKQLWINEDCSEGFYCDSALAGGGRDIKCAEGERIDVNMVNKTWSCIKDDGQCPGAFHVGCEKDPPPPVTICSYANNTLGTCECGKQLFINKDCTEGFFCMNGTFPEGVVADGCRKQCLKDEVLIVNVAENSWNCVPKSVRPGVLPLICPGKFNIECPGNGDIGTCECDKQLWINEDCRKGFYCDSKLAGGGRDIQCKEGERIKVDMVNLSWSCIPDDGQCPGGFHVGCESDPSSAPIRSVLSHALVLGLAVSLLTAQQLS